MPDNTNNINDETPDEEVLVFTSITGEELPWDAHIRYSMREVSYHVHGAWRTFVNEWNRNDDSPGYLMMFPGEHHFRLLWKQNPVFTHQAGYNTGTETPFRDLWHVWGADEDVFQCDDCMAPSDGEPETPCGRSVCDRCYENYGFCEEHDIEYHYDEGCHECQEQERYGSRLIRDYSERVDIVFHLIRNGIVTSTRNLPPRMTATGFELEIEARDGDIDEMAQAVDASLGHLSIMKYDGSLSHGFELVTQPLTHDFLRQMDLSVLSDIAQMGARSAQTTSCGLHVHLNRSYFAGRETSVYTLMRTLYDNSQQWRILAGRDNSTYANWNDTDGETRRALTVAKGTKRYPGRSLGGDRYVPMNTNNGSTFEFRFFKGTLKPSTVLARVESIHALAHFAMNHTPSSIAKTGFTWEKFRNFTEAGDNATRYSHFNTYATQKGI